MKNDIFSVEGRTALVTGGTGGIGYMIARGLVERGAKTYIVGRSADTCERAASELAAFGQCIALVGDISTMAGINDLVKAFQERESVLHILVNNAGAMYEAPLAEFEEQGWDSVVDLNLKSVFFLSQKLLPSLLAGATADAPSSVINIGSVGGLRVGPKENYAYQAAKAGLHHMTGSLAKRLGPQHVTVNAIAPGFFPSKMTVVPDEQLPKVLAMVPRRRMGTADDVIGAVIYLASRAGSFVTGSVLPVEGGMTI